MFLNGNLSETYREEERRHERQNKREMTQKKLEMSKKAVRCPFELK